jgi:hypothetical protein
LVAVSSSVSNKDGESNKDGDLVEYLLEPAMHLCKDFYAMLEYTKGIVIQTGPDS